MKYLLVGNVLYKYDEEGHTVDKLDLGEEYVRIYNEEIHKIDRIYMNELFKLHRKRDEMANTFSEQLFKLFAKSISE